MSHYKERMAEITGQSVPKTPAPEKPKDFYESLCEEYVIMSGRYQGEINRLRRENAALKAQIAATPSLLTELQDRVSLLESLPRE